MQLLKILKVTQIRIEWSPIKVIPRPDCRARLNIYIHTPMLSSLGYLSHMQHARRKYQSQWYEGLIQNSSRSVDPTAMHHNEYVLRSCDQGNSPNWAKIDHFPHGCKRRHGGASFQELVLKMMSTIPSAGSSGLR